MKVYLDLLPHWESMMPHLALPSLAAHLCANGVEVIQRDLNAEVFGSNSLGAPDIPHLHVHDIYRFLYACRFGASEKLLTRRLGIPETRFPPRFAGDQGTRVLEDTKEEKEPCTIWSTSLRTALFTTGW